MAQAKTKTLDDLFHDTLKDIYYAEKKILTALPKMAKAAQSSDLQIGVRQARATKPKDRSRGSRRSSRSSTSPRRARSARRSKA